MKILIIEDDKYISAFLRVSLEKEDYEVLVGKDATEGMFLFSSYHPDIVLLDLGLPDRDGGEVIREIRQMSETPVIVVSSRSQEAEKVAALDAGAIDYVTKPFHMGELLARIRVMERLLIKLTLSHPEEEQFVCDWLTVDFEKRRVLVDGQEVHLTPYEYKLLCIMIRNRGKVLTYNYIIKELYGYESGGAEGVRVFMSNLRRKIEKDLTQPRFILTEVGIGYRWNDQ
ncbi:MAG: response regulator transcription factor [Clostridiales bacterium]|nr:response regulator transcription factor [Clostridiales bacterium]